MKVLILDENKGFGGAERHVVSLAGELQKRGVLAAVVGRKSSWLAGEAARQELEFSPCGFRNEVDMVSVFALWRLIKAQQAEVVHCVAHRDLVAAALALQLPGAPHARLVKAEHSFPDDKLSPLFRWAYTRCQGLVCVSQALKRSLQEALGQLDCPLEVIPNGINPGPEPRERAPAKPLRVGVLSALREGKGQADFLRAVARRNSQDEARTLQVSMAGDGPLAEDLKALAQDLEVECEFLGHCDSPQEYLGTLDLCVLPSQVETFSLVALEALTAGVPLLAADSSGVAELYPHPDRLFPAGDHKALAEGLQAFVDDPQGWKTRALELSAHYRQTYNLERMADNYLAFYQRLEAGE